MVVCAPTLLITAPAQLITAPDQPPARGAVVYTALFLIKPGKADGKKGGQMNGQKQKDFYVDHESCCQAKVQVEVRAKIRVIIPNVSLRLKNFRKS